jgi:hypothetical protein
LRNKSPISIKIFKVNKQESITTTDTNQVRWLYVEGKGKIDELSINSDKDTLKLRIVIDDVEVYNEVLSWYDTNDAILYNIDTSGALLVSIRDIYFKESFTIEYTPAETSNISLIIWRYSVRGDSIKK